MIALIILIVLVLGLTIYWLFFSSYSQFFGAFPYQVQTDKKVVALTFDDGPNEPYTSQILDYLNSQNVKATFFEVGNCIEKYPEVTQRIFASGHVIGNHSTSHIFNNYLKKPSFQTEIESTQEIIKRVIGQTPALFRPPWLFRQRTLLKTARQLKLQVVSGVFCHAFEVLQPSAQRIAQRTLAKVKPGSIIIFHDGFDAKGGNRAQTVAAVKLVIPELQKQGYSFVTVDALLGVKPYL